MPIGDIALNIHRHGVVAGQDAGVDRLVAPQDGRCVLDFEDRGPPVDPTAAALPAYATRRDGARGAGFGVALIRALSAE